MNIVIKHITVLLTAFLYFAVPWISFASDLPPGNPSVICATGLFVAPSTVQVLHYHTEDHLLTTVNNIPDQEFALLKRCGTQLHGAGHVVYLPLAYIAKDGPYRRNVMVLICVPDGAYKFAGVIAPKNDFTYNFSTKDKISKDNPLAQQHC